MSLTLSHPLTNSPWPLGFYFPICQMGGGLPWSVVPHETGEPLGTGEVYAHILCSVHPVLVASFCSKA
jgi:hypothetical protein